MGQIQMQSRHEVGTVTVEQMREVDRTMVEDLHIEPIQMMENAGRHLARVALAVFEPARATVYAGAGGNGGGALVAARHLANVGVEVSVVLSAPARRLDPVAAHQLDIVERIGVAVREQPVDADLGIDGLVGYGLAGEVGGRVAELVTQVGERSRSVLALDVPSGLDADLGTAPGPAVGAHATVTLAMPKQGLIDAPHVGTLYVADISVPPLVYERLGVGPPPDFSRGPVVRLL